MAFLTLSLHHYYAVPFSAARDVLALAEASFAFGGHNTLFRQDEVRRQVERVLQEVPPEVDDLESLLLKAARDGEDGPIGRKSTVNPLLCFPGSGISISKSISDPQHSQGSIKGLCTEGPVLQPWTSRIKNMGPHQQPPIRSMNAHSNLLTLTHPPQAPTAPC
ncbi:hypothetical protein [Deinococcus cellulosilyticus]|uniref:hypothetical protein n=1 Tax=Deinococcus cellulosilyticus TaxID=401558 RepID=UPI0011BDD7A3|nr:hypothetical protein [Deinococcus cellulosilyticus]